MSHVERQPGDGIADDGKASFRTDPMWFTDYMRRSTVEWGRQAAEAAE